MKKEENGSKVKQDDTKTGSSSRPERPLNWDELLERFDNRRAIEEVPAELRHLWSDLSVETPAPVHWLDRPKEVTVTSCDPHQPPWMAVALKPRPAPREVPMTMTHRGQPVQPLVVWGKDDRKTYKDMTFPWASVCRITGTSKRGSGVLIGPRHVLTASHVVDWNGPGETVEVQRAGGFVAATAKVIAKVAFTKITSGVGATTVDEDYAILIVDQPLGKKFGYLGVRTYDSSWDDEARWHSMGYAGDVKNMEYPIRQYNKKLDEDEWDYGPARAMTTTADLMGGQSGSPMFGIWPSGVYVVAVASAVGHIVLSGTENWCSGGSYLTSLVSISRVMFP